jgi:formylglycine-generating enzyme required for sulfatase activity
MWRGFQRWLASPIAYSPRRNGNTRLALAARRPISGEQVGRNNANCNGCGSQWNDQQTFGLYDMAGNVWQWVAPTDSTAWTFDDCTQRVIRGGAWLSSTDKLRSSFRDGLIPGYRVNRVGFRLGRTLAP